MKQYLLKSLYKIFCIRSILRVSDIIKTIWQIKSLNEEWELLEQLRQFFKVNRMKDHSRNISAAGKNLASD